MTVLLNEFVLLNELLLKESMLLEELLLSPTRGCDISLFCCSLGMVDFRYTVEDSENGFLSTVRYSSGRFN